MPAEIGLGIDVGGTYTDAVLYHLSANQLLSKKKAFTTQWDFAVGIGKALAGLEKSLLESVTRVALSSTIATNAIVEDKGQKVGLLLMPPYGLFEPEDVPYEPKEILSGQLDITGDQIRPVEEREIVPIAHRMVRQFKVQAFAVSGFAASINPEHELRVKQILQKETGLTVTCGHELSDLLDFRTRAYTAILNGRIIPLLVKLMSDLERILLSHSIQAPIAVVRGDGSLMRKEVALERPVETILSGPAASVAGAQHLTGMGDALVVDIGGTTTDAAMLRDGRVDTEENGSYVGGHKTHVHALRIRTLGLGGDSFIAWNGTGFEIGPKRVGSMAWLGSHAPGVDRALDYLSEHVCPDRIKTNRLQFLIQQGRQDGLALTDQEKDILGLLKERAYSLQELAEKIGLSYWNSGLIARLENNYFIQRCGFTPTDVLNCRGDLALWDTQTSRRMCDIFSHAIRKNPDAMIDELMQDMTRRLALLILKRQLDEDVNADKLEDCSVCQLFVKNIFGEGRREFDIRLKMHMPVVGIGAPAHLLLPSATSLLGAELVVPAHAEVANAIGAVTSQVLVRRHVEIRACRAGGFRIEGMPGIHHFRHFDKAFDYAKQELTQIVRRIAADSGTKETAVEIQTEDHVLTMINGRKKMMGCVVMAELKGAPCY